MHTYILFVIIGQWQYSSLTVQEFNTFDTCITAKNAIEARDNQYHPIQAFCVGK